MFGLFCCVLLTQRKVFCCEREDIFTAKKESNKKIALIKLNVIYIYELRWLTLAVNKSFNLLKWAKLKINELMNQKNKK